jgi:hypothetical protein
MASSKSRGTATSTMVHNHQNLQIGALSGRVAKITTKNGVLGRKGLPLRGAYCEEKASKSSPLRNVLIRSAAEVVRAREVKSNILHSCQMSCKSWVVLVMHCPRGQENFVANGKIMLA